MEYRVAYSNQIACPAHQAWCLVWKHSSRQVDPSCNLFLLNAELFETSWLLDLVMQWLVALLSEQGLSLTSLLCPRWRGGVTCCDLTRHLPGWLPSFSRAWLVRCDWEFKMAGLWLLTGCCLLTLPPSPGILRTLQAAATVEMSMVKGEIRQENS
jgi:hypothetical protein